MKLTAYDKPMVPDREDCGGARPRSVLPCTRADIRLHPGRVVSINTAYYRMMRDERVSLDDACTTPLMKVLVGDKTKHMTKEYVADLKSSMRAKDVATKYGMHVSTVRRHRGEELKQIEYAVETEDFT